MNKVKRGDEVIVLCGRDKGKRGTIKSVELDSLGKPARVLAEGLNIVTHYERPDPQKNRPGGIIGARRIYTLPMSPFLTPTRARRRELKLKLMKRVKKFVSCQVERCCHHENTFAFI